jgi:hypothetical protein
MIRNRFALLCLALCVFDGAHADRASSFYASAPGTPVCSTADAVVCAWSANGLVPTPKKYAVEAIATYDPQCDGAAVFSASFAFTTIGPDPSIDFPTSALDTLRCISGDDPCSVVGTVRAQRVQVRVKALHPPSNASGAQDNPFSALSPPMSIAGVCASVACPQTCASAIDSFLAQMSAIEGQVGLDNNLFCSYDGYQQAGTISYGGITPTGVSPIVQGAALIGVGSCVASIDGVPLVSMGLAASEQAACAEHYAPIFANLAATACAIGPP